MNTEPVVNHCPKCQVPLPASAPQGLCPRCLLAAAATPTEAGQPAHAAATPPPLETVAAAFPQLEILELIGSGGMGVVYKVRQPRLDRSVALKLLPQSLAADAAFAERFNREARLLARLNHPNIVTVHDFGQSGGFFYLLMEFVDGVNLRQAMEAGRFTPHQALVVVPKICEALQYAHDEGILHRDIKPSNILLDARGRVKIADFGIAKLIGDRMQDMTLTASGAAIGTPQYMAPEQLEHPQDVDQRADIYSLGVVFYEMLTGELPIGRFAPPSAKAAVDSRVDDVVFRALEKEREKRFRSAGEVKTSVEAITAGGSERVPGSPAAAVTPPGAPKTSLCYVTTPEYLRTFRGRFLYLYQGNGQLRLDTQTLSFISGWQQVTIPLASIRVLTVGEYSLAAKPVPLHYLEITFLEHGDSRTLFFTPTHSGLSPVWETNKVVAEWASAVQQATQAVTGRTITLNRAKDVRGRSWGEVLKTFELTAVLCSLPFLLIPIFVEHRPPNRWTDYLPGPLITAILLGSLLLVRWSLERRALRKGNLSEVTSHPVAYDKDDPILFRTVASDEAARQESQPGARPVSAAMHLIYLLIYLLLCFLMLGPWIGDFTGGQFRLPVPDWVGKPLGIVTLLLVIYGAVHKSWRQAEAKRRAAAGGPSGLPPTAKENDLPAARHPEPVHGQETADVPAQAGRRSVCYFSTPKRMRNCFPGPQAHIFQCKGELRLDAAELIFVSPWQTRVVMALKEISDLSIGQFQMRTTPWVRKYARFNFLSITLGASGKQRTVCLTPVPSGPAFPALINAQVAEWFEAVRQAVVASTGTSPHVSEPGALTIRARSAWNRKGIPLMFAPIVAWLVGIISIRCTNESLLALPGVAWVLALLSCLALGWFTVGFLKANQALKSGDLDAVTSDEPPGDRVAGDSPDLTSPGKSRRPLAWTLTAWFFLVFGIIAVIFTLAMLYTRPFDFTLYPGWAHLFTGVAMLTLSRRWRIAAFVVLVLMGVGGAWIGLSMILSPGGAVVLLPAAGMRISADKEPLFAAAAAVFLTLVYAWPWYMLCSSTGRRLFARSSNGTANRHVP